MAPPLDDTAQSEERLKSALWYTIGQLTDHECLASLSSSSSAGDASQPHNATPQFIGALTELVWAQVRSAGKDLEDFARHAGRGTIRKEDVLLLARRNEGLEGLLREFAHGLDDGGGGAEGAAVGKGKMKTKGSSRGRGKGR